MRGRGCDLSDRTGKNRWCLKSEDGMMLYKIPLSCVNRKQKLQSALMASQERVMWLKHIVIHQGTGPVPLTLLCRTSYASISRQWSQTRTAGPTPPRHRKCGKWTSYSISHLLCVISTWAAIGQK